MDPLTDILTAMRVENAMYTRLEASAPWGISFKAYEHTKFGVVLHGGCWLTVEGEARPVRLNEGDCYILARGNAFSLRDELDSATRAFGDVQREQSGDVIRYGGGGAPMTLIGGRFVFEGPDSKPLTDVLPTIIHFKMDHAGGLALRTTLELLALETATPTLGSQLVISRLADIFLVQAIRGYILSDTSRTTGWLGALADPHIGAALRLMHEQTRHPWTVEGLSDTVGMSRSAFALRFKQLVGSTPLEYLTEWRMHKAGRLLRESHLALAQVADAIGYDSEGAFSKAFKRVLGVPPGKYRRDRVVS
jgi:AraC-like DNA-binding protein